MAIDITGFITTAKKIGIPSTFLEKVQAYYKVKGDSANTSHTSLTCGLSMVTSLIADCRTVHLEPDEATDVKDFTKNQNISYLSSVGVFYHECTHAYFDLIMNQQEVTELHPKGKKLIKDAIDYYRDAPLNSKDKTKADDPARVFTEAAATYVQTKVFNWLSTNYGLINLLNLKPHVRLIDAQQVLNNIINRYAIKNQAFGYQQRDRTIFGTASGPQVYTTKTIMPALKLFLDSQLLEDKIPDSFANVPKFKKMVATIKSKPPFTQR